MLIQLARDFISGLLDLVYPTSCLICGQEGDAYLCAECIEKIDVIEPPFCRKCGFPFDSGVYICADCKKREYEFESAYSVGTFDGNLRKAIHELKFSRHQMVAEPLAELMARCFYKTHLIGEVDVAVPIPIHRSRFIDRGFNQSEEIARIFCARLGLPLERSLFIKKKRTPDQVNLGADQRAINLEGAFAVTNSESIRDKRILLIDDVFTTGATLNEAAKTLKEAGALSVYAYTLARAL